ncbi:MAG: PQQ-binding-like beta-propeller repeat protein [Planctomycetaceae bacterium]
MFFKHLRTWLASTISTLVPAHPQRRYRRRGWWIEGVEDRTLLSLSLGHILLPEGRDTQTYTQFGTALASNDSYVVAGRRGLTAGNLRNGGFSVYNSHSGELLYSITGATYRSSLGESVAVSDAFIAASDNGLNGPNINIYEASTGRRLRAIAIPDIGVITNPPNTSLVISGNRLFVGAVGYSTSEFDHGAVYVFDINTGEQLLRVVNPSVNTRAYELDRFGCSIAVSGNRLFVGSESESQDAYYAGKLYEFDLLSGELVTAFSSPSPSHGGKFGHALIIESDTLIVSEPQSLNYNPGSVYIYELQSMTVLRRISLPEFDIGTQDDFGSSIDLHGDVLLVGAARLDRNGYDAGAAYVFDRTTGSLMFLLHDATNDEYDSFGAAVTLSGGFAWIGAPGTNAYTGTLSLFDVTNGNLSQRINAPTAAAVFDGFGTSVAATNSVIAVGSPGDDTTEYNAGSVTVSDAITGQRQWFLQAPSPRMQGEFGSAVSILGDTLFVGAGYAPVGESAIFAFDIESQTVRFTIPTPIQANEVTFGTTIVTDNDLVVVADRYSTPLGRSGGAVYVYDASNGELRFVLHPPSPSRYAEFGYSVAVSETMIAVGSPSDDTRGENSGAVFLFSTTDGRLIDSIYPGAPSSTTEFGRSVAIQNRTLLVGEVAIAADGSETSQVLLIDLVSRQTQQTFHGESPDYFRSFGTTVAMVGSAIVVGSPSGTPYGGSIYLFDVRTGILFDHLSSPDTPAFLRLGASLAVTPRGLTIGAPSSHAMGYAMGAALTFQNMAPESIILSTGSVNEEVPIGTVVGSLSSVDDNATAVVYTLVSGTGDASNGSFTIESNNLKVMAELDFEQQPSHTIRVRATDVFGIYSESIIRIDVLDVNDPATLNVSQVVTGLSEATNTSAAIKIAGVAIVDDALGTNVLSLTGTDAALFELIGGELFLRSGVSLDFETKPQLNVTIEVDDSDVGASPDDAVNLTVNVLDANELPHSA